MSVIDAHAHLWRRARTPQPWIEAATMADIDRDFTSEDLRDAQRAAGIDGAIVVQSSNSTSETRDLLSAVDGVVIRGVVGWVDLTGDVAGQLDEVAGVAGGDRLVGLRHLVYQDLDPRWLDRGDVGRGLDRLGARGLPFDLVVRHDQLKLAAEVVGLHPGTRFVLDHLGKPPLARDLGRWRRDIAAMARLDNVVAKVSGLAIEGDWDSWTLEQLRVPVEWALDCFGPTRLLFGSDWPLVRLTRGAHAWLSAIRMLTDSLSASERASLFGGATRETYLEGAHA